MTDHNQTSIGREAAIKLAESGWLKSRKPGEAAAVQLYVKELCMDFSDFHKDMEALLGRPVWTHEFADVESLQREHVGLAPTRTLADVMQAAVDLVGVERVIVAGA